MAMRLSNGRNSMRSGKIEQKTDTCGFKLNKRKTNAGITEVLGLIIKNED